MIKHIFLLLLFSTVCTVSHAQLNSLQQRGKQSASQVPYIIMEERRYNGMELQLFVPHHLRLGFTTTRPERDDNQIFFSAAAAFTGKDLVSICGAYIVNGVAGKNFYRGRMNGYIAMCGDDVVIKSVNDSLSFYKTKAMTEGGCYFEQCLLVKENRVVPCKLFSGRRVRRAVVLKAGKSMIVESKEKVMIDDFSEALVALGVDSALYLDMGGWSLGWYINKQNVRKYIGFQTPNTVHQTNWIIFTR